MRDVEDAESSSSPLKMALAATPPPTTATPLLTASLNSPPVPPPPVEIRFGSAGIDLSQKRNKRKQDEENNNAKQNDMYANLLMHLRKVQAAQQMEASPKMTAAARKEKLKAQLCFQCPVCKKRFQRHIAMNAHFQNEHLGVGPGDQKICRICTKFRSADLSGIRSHLHSVHGIDLETPTACLAEPEVSISEVIRHPDISSSSSESSPMSGRESPNGDRYFFPIKPAESKRDGVSVTAIPCKKRPRKAAPAEDNSFQCQHCNIVFPNQTLYFLHRGFHSDADPWRCNGCGLSCADMYEFNTHLVSDSHN